MKKRKFSFTAQLYITSIAILLTAMIVTIAVYTYFAVSIKSDDLETTITDLSGMVSDMDAVKKGIERGSFSEELTDLLDLVADSFEYADVLSICDTDGIRIYHSNPDEIGKHFIGGDEGPILSGSDPYVSKATGTMGYQLRSFHSVTDADGAIIGFVMASIKISSIDIIRRQLIISSLPLLLLLLPIGLLISWASVHRLRSILMGYSPEEFSDKYIERSEVLDALDEGIFAINKGGNVILMNASAKQMLQLGADEVPEGGKLTDIYPETQLPKTVESGIPEHDINFLMKGRNIISSRIPVRSSGRIIGAVSIFRDKTEVVHLADELTGAKYMVETLRAFNHDFMNKMHVILGLLEMHDTEGAKRFILGTSLVSGQAVSNISHMIPVPQLAALIIGKLIRANELGIYLSLKADTDFSAETAALPADCYVTLVGNLLENAMDELNSASYPLKRIELGLYVREGMTIICCDDTGGGIAPEILCRIFERDATTKGEGHGSGFAIMKEIVDLYHGSINIDTEEGEGTSIEIVLPL